MARKKKHKPRRITFRGETLTIWQWSQRTGIPDATIRSRLDRLGLSVEDALTRPVASKFRPVPAGEAAVRPVPPLAPDERGRAVARWVEGDVKRVKVFGKHGSPEAAAAYARWAAEWYAGGGRPVRPGEDVSVAGLVVACLDWAEKTYRKGGKITSEVHGYRAALAALNDLYGDTPAAAFGPLQLRAVRAVWVSQGKGLTTCNNYLSKVQRCFSFGAGNGLIPAAVADALAHVERLVPGRSDAPVYDPVTGVGDDVVAKVLPHLDDDPERLAVFQALVKLQRASGMRPGEVVGLRPADLDRTREPWLYRPPGHKTMHHDRDRRVYLGPAAREILAPWLDGLAPGDRVFRLRAYRKRAGREWLAISTNLYRDVLADACRKAGVSAFRPNQLRHAKATEIQRAYEDDAAVAAVLGNSPELARQVYVDGPADAVARRIAEELG